MKVTHVGNDPSGPGGIASVIRRHLTRSWETQVDFVVSYHQSAPTAWLRNRAAAEAAAVIARTRPTREQAWHFHVSQKGSLIREGVLMWLARLRGHRNVVVTIHGSGAATLTPTNLRVYSWVLRAASQVHVLSARHREKFRRLNPTVIPNDVDLPTLIVPWVKRDKVVLFGGEISTRKGVDLLLRAWSDLSDLNQEWNLFLCGPTADTGSEYTQRYSDISSGVHWMGPVPHDSLMDIMSRSRVVVLPSRAEAFPMVICEAIARACAVVATDVGGTGDLIADRDLLIPSDDAQALTVALRSVLADTALAERAAAMNRERANELFSPVLINRRWMAVYTQDAQVTSR